MMQREGTQMSKPGTTADREEGTCVSVEGTLKTRLQSRAER